MHYLIGSVSSNEKQLLYIVTCFLSLLSNLIEDTVDDACRSVVSLSLFTQNKNDEKHLGEYIVKAFGSAVRHLIANSSRFERSEPSVQNTFSMNLDSLMMPSNVQG